MKDAKAFMLTEVDEVKYFAPKTWIFWRGVIICFCLFCLVGHWMEIPYVMTMDFLFHVVEDDYAVWDDPLWVPYWVYGFGTVIATLTLFPLKIYILEHRRTMVGAILQYFVVAVLIAAVLELVIGLMINQPDPITGKYPFWDNSVLPFNIFNQAWAVNDVLLGLVSLFYVFVVFPFIQKAFMLINQRTANRLFVFVIVFFLFCCFLTYVVPHIPDLYNFLT